MTPYFKDGKLYKPLRIETKAGVIGDGAPLEIPKGSDEYKETYAMIERHPEWQADAHWEEREK
jgi:hypothetical protein